MRQEKKPLKTDQTKRNSQEMSDNQTSEQLNNIEAEPSPELTQEPETSITHVEDVNTTKPKKKKKKNKNGSKPSVKTVFYGPSGQALSAPVGSEAEPLTYANSNALEDLPQVPQTVLNLPVKPDEWFIHPATHDEENNQITEETFTFLKDGIEIISMPLNHDNFEALSQLLNERFTTSNASTEADFFHIRKPLTDSEDSDPVMTLTQKNRILASTSLDQKSLKQLIRALQKHVEKPTTATVWLNRWWKKHKIWRVILIIASLPVVLLFLYTIFWGVTH